MIFSVGYEGKSVAAFLDTLRKNGINVVVDVRELPLSRKKGFSKTQLQKLLSEVGIEYVAEKRLGNPYRKMLKARELSWDGFKILFENYLRSNIDAVEKVVEMNHSRNVCLLCYEKDHKNCHRSVISDVIEKDFGIHVIHL